MLYEQQQVQEARHQLQGITIKKKTIESRNKGIEEPRLEIVDLSGMSMDSLPNPSSNLATICKLDLSNNNLQVHTNIIIYLT